MSGAQIHVRLFRDSFNTPWGFRLQGGKDLNQILTVQRVFSNSPAEGELQRGDVILQIGDKRAQDLTHKQAQDLIKFGGGQINLIIQRPPTGHIAPQTPRQHSVQAPKFRQPHSPMPTPGGQSYGFTPKKITLSKLGGGGPSFGSDYGSVPVQRGYQPMSAMVAAQQASPGGSGGGYQMLNRVQESLDNIILSPRSPEPPYQSPAPFYQQPSQPPTYQGYIPTSARIDMQQQQQIQQQQREQQQHQPYAQGSPHPPTWIEAPAPTTAPLGPTSQHAPLSSLRARLDAGEPVSAAELLLLSMVNAPPPSNVPKPRRVPGPSYPVKAPEFGVDYAAPKARGQAPQTWQPNYGPSGHVAAQAPPHIHPKGPDSGTAPWRETLKTTGVKPWDKELQYTAETAPAPVHGAPRYQPPPAPASNFSVPAPDDQDDGPKVVHLQYNSPMGLYSNRNIQETFEGQTKAMATQGAPPPQGQQGKPGDRDWNQSSVYRMIKEQETRRTTSTTFSPSAPMPIGQQQQSFRRLNPPDDEVGISDF